MVHSKVVCPGAVPHCARDTPQLASALRTTGVKNHGLRPRPDWQHAARGSDADRLRTLPPVSQTRKCKPVRLDQGPPGAFYVNQFANPANPRAHETSTGPEILQQMDGDIDAVVVGVGSGGTLTGLGRCMRTGSKKTRMILADPLGSILKAYVETGQM